MHSVSIAAVPGLVRKLYQVVAEFETLFKGRKFTLDGHIVGSVGEVCAAYHYDLELLPASTKVHDAKSKDGTQVQIKATQGNAVGLRAEPEHLLVLFLASNGEMAEVFNGPGQIVWKACGPMQKNGQRRISVKKLRDLMATVDSSVKLSMRN
jgi:hypothetical protein